MEFFTALFDAVLDPVTWMVMAISIGIAVALRPWWWAAISAVLGAVVLAAIVSYKDASIGVATKPGIELASQILTILIWSQAAFWITRTIAVVAMERSRAH